MLPFFVVRREGRAIRLAVPGLVMLGGLIATPAMASVPAFAQADGLETPTAAARMPSEGRDRTQQRLRAYLRRLLQDAESAPEEPIASAFPSLGSAVLDAQLAGYIAYVETAGTPDILIVGSSRSLQGIDPAALGDRLSEQGYDSLRVYNFSVNGATAQVVNFILSELLPGELPGVIVWGDGSRAFNDGRRDRTWESLIASPGFQAVRRGEQPMLSVNEPAAEPMAALERQNPVTAQAGLTALGFSVVSDRFEPVAYYREFPKVNGRYDGAYSPFTLQGAQAAALADVASFVSTQNAQLIFVNLPLSDSYLDDFRSYYERQFQQFLQLQSVRQGFKTLDFLRAWPNQSELFADPSHINQDGAAAIAAQLAMEPVFLSALSTLFPETDTANTQESPEQLDPADRLERLLNTSPLNQSFPEMSSPDSSSQ